MNRSSLVIIGFLLSGCDPEVNVTYNESNDSELGAKLAISDDVANEPCHELDGINGDWRYHKDRPGIGANFDSSRCVWSMVGCKYSFALSNLVERDVSETVEQYGLTDVFAYYADAVTIDNDVFKPHKTDPVGCPIAGSHSGCRVNSYYYPDIGVKLLGVNCDGTGTNIYSYRD